MPSHDLNARLSRISTIWEVIDKAHDGNTQEVTAAQTELIRRYGPAVYRYLMAGVRDRDVADELTQEFALRMLRGDFRGADPQRGRFRHYVKAVLFRMVKEHSAREQKQPIASPVEEWGVADVETADQGGDSQFTEAWQNELLARTWKALEANNAHLFRVLRGRADHPNDSSEQLAQRLSDTLEKEIGAATVRQTLRRAREMFANLLVDEVAFSINSPDVELLHEELIELGLYKYCAAVLDTSKNSGE